VVVPSLSRVLGGTPDTYQPAGPERGTATSTSTTTGTTSVAIVEVAHDGRAVDVEVAGKFVDGDPASALGDELVHLDR
jgi:hypothetical protein